MKIFTKSSKLTKKAAVILVLIVALLLSGAVILRASPGCGFGVSELINMSDPEGREKYLRQYGWEIDVGSETEENVLLPREFGGALAEYSRLQNEQGYELSSYAGLECRRYTYTVTNYPSDDTVYVTMFVKNGRLIGGDIHSAAIDGFMHGIR